MNAELGQMLVFRRNLRVLVTVWILSSLGWSKPDTAYQDFIADLLRDHGEKKVVVDSGGVGVKGNPTRLAARECDAQAKDGGWIVEMELQVHLPGGHLTEYTTGVGRTREAARQACLENFTLSTFHVIYKAFLNQADPHMELYRFRQGKLSRICVAGELVSMGDGTTPRLSAKLERQIREVLLRHTFRPGPHTAKIVYVPGLASSVAIDGREQPALAEALKKLAWPKTAKPYMAKQFVVIR